MSFVDKVSIEASAGRGGDGRRSFRRQKFVSRGGPDGGDGGKGGDIILRASPNQNTLAAFRYKKSLKASDGSPGDKNRKHGKNADDLVIDVPIGTEVKTPEGQLISDLINPDDQTVIAKGGKGGFGNAHFVSSTRQAPNFAELGEPGEKLDLNLELKLIADVGLVGLPNAGKSTLLSKLSNAHPEIADYPFTTLTPNLGVCDIDETTSILVADIPGLIAGAAEGKGLGHDFLRHIERTRLIVHLIDVYQEDIVASYNVVRNELKAYSKLLDKLPEVVVINKIDGYNEQALKQIETELKKNLKRGSELLTISAKANLNLDQLKYVLKKRLNKLYTVKIKDVEELPRITLADTSSGFEISKTAAGFKISGPKIDRFGARTDFKNTEAVDRLKVIMRKMGIIHELLRRGLKPGDKITIGRGSFIF